MPQRELESAETPKASVPMTRREARELEAAAAAKASIFPVTDASAASESAPRFTPTQPKAQARRSPVATAAPTVRRPSLAARVSRKLLSVGALLGAGALLVGMTVPANAFMSDPITFAPEEVAAAKLPAQSISVPAEAATEATAKDTYEVISYAEQLKALYSSSNFVYAVTSGSVRWPFPFVSP